MTLKRGEQAFMSDDHNENGRWAVHSTRQPTDKEVSQTPMAIVTSGERCPLPLCSMQMAVQFGLVVVRVVVRTIPHSIFSVVGFY